MNFNFKKYPILYLAKDPVKLRLLSKKNLLTLSKELRKFLLKSVSISSGHLASGLGVIELTISLHYVYNTSFDKIIWDIGHQAYPHKILTNRRDKIFSIRKYNGLHSFPSIKESKYDSFSVGHSSTSISAGLGMSVAAENENLQRKIISIIGDGALTGGMAFEAMNHAGSIKNNILIILNDNKMSISNNVGALNDKFLHLNYKNIINNNFFLKKNIKKNLTPKKFFENLGFNYFGPINGHKINDLINILYKIKNKKGPKILHIITQKGHGYKPAEKNPIKWHSVPSFNIKNNSFYEKSKIKFSYSDIFGEWLCSIAKNDKKLMVITPAMCEGSGLSKFSKKFSNQYFDVAIAEQHAVTFAAGLSISGYKPVVSIYSTFLQRAYDQIIHDVAIQNLKILFAIDRGGVVGEDGETHQGAFDLTFLRCIPNLTIMTPSNKNELRFMLHTSYNFINGPSIVRYPKKYCNNKKLKILKKIPIGKGIIHKIGNNKMAILNFGSLFNEAKKISNKLNLTLVDMRFIKPLDKKLIIELSKNHKSFLTLEENSLIGGAGSAVNECLIKNHINIPILNIGFPDYFIPQGNKNEIYSLLGLNYFSIKEKIKKLFIKYNI
ncbi:1-deoxy-D-xylulose-5-phosphate synthase [Sodalis-like secondary symbiont of Drepanosiphum platanoidis]|uniref:1-deoxy-D-xylulose-5-phosphate synthase n=1 Tax=Sodalis-like secondary symbiont of Drepanosiphum platanoidis TaxID=2994493 RepID=UPI003463A06C